MPDLPDDIGLLARHLRLSCGRFSLAFVRWNLGGTEGPGIEQIRAAAADLTHVTFDVAEIPPISFMAELESAPPGDVLHLLGLYRHLPEPSKDKSPDPMLRVLNMQRELWKTITRPVVIWLPESCLKLIARYAADFWSWRSGVFEFVMPEFRRTEIAIARNWDDSGNYLDIPDDEIPGRIETLTNLWHELHEDGELPRKQWETGIDIAVQLIVLHGHRSEFVEQEQWRDRAIELLKRLQMSSDTSPNKRANFANSEGILWQERPTRNRGENLLRAIECYESALTVWTKDRFPQDWAMTQNNLGAAYQELPTGDRGENLIRAIECYESALTVRTKDRFPQQWATTQNNLGIAYRNLSAGDQVENLKRAIECYESALTVWTKDRFPQQWATTQNNLGAAYQELPTGDRVENLIRAIECYESALTVRTKDRFPKDWAMTQNNLGNAYQNLPTGDRSENLKRAIGCYESALTVWTKDRFPQQWATTQNNLGAAYQELPTGDRVENLIRAIECYESALTVRTKDRFPKDWAMTQNNLGNAYRELPTGDRGENLKRAIKCYESALTVQTKDRFPQDWAMTQGNLASVFSDWSQIENRDANRQKAIEHISNSIQGYKECGDKHGLAKREKILARWHAEWGTS